MKNQISLSGEWKVSLFPQNKKERTLLNEAITLPDSTSRAGLGKSLPEFSTEHLTEQHPFTGRALFERTIELPKGDIGEKAVLYLERTRISRVRVNGEEAGTDNSLTTPHEHEISGLLKEGSNTICVEVSNTGYPIKGGHMTSPDTQTNWNGILGKICILMYDAVRMERVTVKACAENRQVQVRIPVAGWEKADGRPVPKFTFSVKEKGKDGEEISFHVLSLIWREEKSEAEVLLSAPDLKPWEEHTPFVYELKLFMTCGDCRDSQTVSFGMRDLSRDERHFKINGHPVFLRGKHDGLTFPKTGFAPMDTASWIGIFREMKEYGINHYRFHTCCPPEAAFFAADEVGMYLQPELPFWGTLSGPGEKDYDPEISDYLRSEGLRILKAYGNHPSFLAMSLGNELWGNLDLMNELLRCFHEADDRHWYTQGSNNFQFSPQIAEQDDFFSGVRCAGNRLFRGSYAMCDAPLGRIQTKAPGTDWNYDEEIRPSKEGSEENKKGTILIQRGTGVEEVRLSNQKEFVPRIPVVSHEIGQYYVYPDYRDLSKYDGVLKADCLEVFRKRLADAGMQDRELAFFENSGKLAAACYKEELEAALRTKELAGFQILDLQDFMGQGIATVGILNAFLENKGLISPENWRKFCSDAVLLGQFPGYVLQAGTEFKVSCSCAWYRSLPAEKDRLTAELIWDSCENFKEDVLSLSLEKCEDRKNIASGLSVQNNDDKTVVIPNSISQEYANKVAAVSDSFLRERYIKEDNFQNVCGNGKYVQMQKTDTAGWEENGLYSLGSFVFSLPNVKTPTRMLLRLSLENLSISNEYEFWVYPRMEMVTQTSAENIFITSDYEKAEAAFAEGKKVLLLPDAAGENQKNRIESAYCTDFWNYPMFRSISESMGKRVPVGTCGLVIEKDHPALSLFPCQTWSTPQWFDLAEGAFPDLLPDASCNIIVQVIDNPERNGRIGFLYEKRQGDGHLLVCHGDLWNRQKTSLSARWLLTSLISWLSVS